MGLADAVAPAVAVGGPGPVLTPSWDFWLPAYMALSFVLIVVFVSRRVTPFTGVACLVVGTLWAWVDNALGVVPAGTLAFLVAVLAGAFARRIATAGGRR
jgi:hypothetical protein